MASRGRTLADLAGLLDATVTGDAGVMVDAVTHDSRRAGPETLYVALRGDRFDGHDFIPDVVSRGAAAVCVDHSVTKAVPELIVADTRQALGPISAEVYDNPSRRLAVVGVTGTNGKTTVTHLVESIASMAGLVTGLMGTIHTRYAGRSTPAALTTPEAPEFQALLADMVDAGVSLVAAEVSSHALELGRVRATRFAVAAFTNLSQDHLDFHGDMDAYLAAKRRLFTEYEVGTAVFNTDDPAGADVAAAYAGTSLTVGRDGDVTLSDVEPMGSGQSRVHLSTPWGDAEVIVPLVGLFNLSNLAVAVACSVAAGIDFDIVAGSLPHVAGVPGRFEVVSGDDPITVVVDYAHTPEAVARAVETAREMTSGRVIALLGAGGDRDRVKRPAMGTALSTADLAIVTSDNPRSEDPEAILSAVSSGLAPDRPHLIEVDRRRAIDAAIAAAGDGDVVLVLGRGHEPEQQIGGRRLPFDDRIVAADALRRHRRSVGLDTGSGSMTP